ncbi:hypothetical protein C0995_008583 [Termitomyces sp. Mi166|nr:hypothetical protein C0995_008583 [Termitomyces sp. Mi166\
MSQDASTITDAQIAIAGVLAYACTIPGTIICGLVLMAYGLAALSPIARKCFDRVSFRLLVYSLISNVLFGIAYAATPTSPGVGCNVGAFAVNLTLMFATYFTTSIAFNLMLVLAFGCDGNKLEKYYLIVTTVISLALNVPTMALGQFGWNDLSATCWYSNANQELRLRWIIATQSFWISLAVATEAICSFYVIFWLFRVSRELSFWTAFANRPTSERMTNSMSNRGVSLLTRDPRYRLIIFRIALYPIVSLFMNFSTVILDLNMSIVGVNTQLDFRLLVLDLVLYGLRTLAYGVLAAGDPSFIAAIRDIRRSRNPSAATDDKRTFTNLFFASAHTGSQVESVVGTHKINTKEVNSEMQESSGVSQSISESSANAELALPEAQDDINKIARQL